MWRERKFCRWRRMRKRLAAVSCFASSSAAAGRLCSRLGAGRFMRPNCCCWIRRISMRACYLGRLKQKNTLRRQAQPFVFHRQPSQEGGKSGSGWHLPMNLCMPIFRRCWLGSQTPIGDITAACGYQSGGHFAAAFKQQFGCLPSDVRT